MKPMTMPTPSAEALPARGETHAKRSFLKLPVPIDVVALLRDYRSIPASAWEVSHWDIHASTAMVLLRGGKKGTDDDFVTAQVSDAPILATLPYLAHLVSDDGPFGQPTYAFIFRMKPMGVSRPHTDDNPAWKDPFRLHLPITTNPGAFLLSEGRAKHIPVGEAWTFDNQTLHAAINGDGVRTHLIIDVPENPRLGALLEAAEWDPGVLDPPRWQRAGEVKAQPTLAALRSAPLTSAEKAQLGLDPEGFASRITERRWLGRLTLAPIHPGDVVHAVNGVAECAMARTATDYIQLRHQPGETLQLGILRDGQRIVRPLTIYRNPLPEPMRRALWRVRDALRHGAY